MLGSKYQASSYRLPHGQSQLQSSGIRRASPYGMPACQTCKASLRESGQVLRTPGGHAEAHSHCTGASVHDIMFPRDPVLQLRSKSMPVAAAAAVHRHLQRFPTAARSWSDRWLLCMCAAAVRHAYASTVPPHPSLIARSQTAAAGIRPEAHARACKLAEPTMSGGRCGSG